jgi:hypothetical protein
MMLAAVAHPAIIVMPALSIFSSFSWETSCAS